MKPRPREVHLANGMRAWRCTDGLWMVYTDRVYGYVIPGYLHTVTRDKDVVRQLGRAKR